MSPPGLILSVRTQGKKVWDIPDELWLNMQRNDNIQPEDVFVVLNSIDFSLQTRADKSKAFKADARSKSKRSG